MDSLELEQAITECYQVMKEAGASESQALIDAKALTGMMQSISGVNKNAMGSLLSATKEALSLRVASRLAYKEAKDELYRLVAYPTFARDSATVMQAYCLAIGVSVGKYSSGDFARWMKAKVKLVRKVRSGLWAESGLTLAHANKYKSLRYLVKGLKIARNRASMKECSEVDHELWAWVSRAKREGASLSTGVCQLGGYESLAAMFSHAYVMHASVGTIAVSKGEKAKAKAPYAQELHPYADTDSTLMQAYCHDETGRAVIAPFPKRPTIAKKNSKRRATLAPCIGVAP